MHRRYRNLIKLALLLGLFVFFLTDPVRLVQGSGPNVNASTHPDTFQLDFANVRAKGPKLSLRSAIVVNYDNGEVLFAKDAERVHPIASLSKLVAAMVLLDSKVNLDTTMQTVSKEDCFQSSRSHLRAGWKMNLENLLHCSLMISDNRATRAIARAVSGDIVSFVALMNKKVAALGLTNTKFFDPTGLDERNVSTAHELALIVHHAYKYEEIAQITSKKSAKITFTSGKKNRVRKMQLSNTNRLVNSAYTVLTGKTGYIDESAYCLATLVEDAGGHKLTLVLLGAPGGNLRFREARKLANWGFSNI